MATRTTPLTDVLGGKTAKVFASGLGLTTVGELIRHYPRRFNKRGELTDLSHLVEGEEVTVQAEIEAVNLKRIPGRKLSILEVTIRSGSGRASLSFFNQQWRQNSLKPGMRGLFAGKVSRFRNKMQLNSPDYILVEDSDELQTSDFQSALIPIYPASAGLPSWTIAKSIELVLSQLDEVAETLSLEIRARAGLMDLAPALRQIHLPDTMGEYYQARKRLAFDEAFGVQLVLAQRRAEMSANPAVARPRVADGLVDAFHQRLPFTFTGEQTEIAELISSELAGEHPMHRLLQGEVGSGKTVVALRAMLQVVDNGAQAALLAPTEVLAGQHAATIVDLLGDLATAGTLGSSDRGTKVVLLTGSMPAAVRRAALLDAASGAGGIVVGTHALIQDHVQFADLGLVVIDEQHRFGVEQRDALRSKASSPPHMLVMTATPIPRTVAMTVFGDLEISELRELPSGRGKIVTTVVPAADKPAWLDRMWQRVREEIGSGRQAFIVCPRIGDGDDGVGEHRGDEAAMGGVDDIGVSSDDEGIQTAAVLSTFAELNSGALADLRLALLHGRMPADEKNRVMSAFAAGDIDVLVATTVIEVGINVPNATLMIVLDADRYGVSQLHQLRGRVGRGGHEAVCLLHTQLPIGHPAMERLTEVAQTIDGFELALLDLKQRREGDVLGAAQSGRKSQLKLLSLLKDGELITSARTEAQYVIDADPTLIHHLELQEFLWDNFDSDRTEYLHKS